MNIAFFVVMRNCFSMHLQCEPLTLLVEGQYISGNGWIRHLGGHVPDCPNMTLIQESNQCVGRQCSVPSSMDRIC